MMRLAKGTLVAVGICTVALAATAFSQVGGGDRQNQNQNRAGAGAARARICPVTTMNPPSARVVQMMATQLELTEVQVAQVTNLVNAYTESTKQTRAAAEKANQALTQALTAGSTDADQILQLATTAAKYEQAMMKAQAQFWASFNGMLSQEQRTKYWSGLNRMGGQRGQGGMGGQRMGNTQRNTGE